VFEPELPIHIITLLSEMPVTKGVRLGTWNKLELNGTWKRSFIACEWMKTNYLKRYCGQTLEVKENVADRNQDGMTG